MEETQNSTIETTSSEQTTQETATDVQPAEKEQTTEQAENEPAKNEDVTTESVEENKEEPTTNQEESKQDWEKIAKDNQASFTRVSQELAELKKQIADSKPQMVKEGKINPKFEQAYKFDVDSQEFQAYDTLARQLDSEIRNEVERLLAEAKTLYNPSNKKAYEAKLNQIKDYFRADIVEQIALEKQKLYNNIDAEFNKALQKDRQERAARVEENLKNVPDVKALIDPESENYSPDVFGIVKTMFDLTGDVDFDSTSKAIAKIKEVGVKEYLAKQNAEAERKKATVPSGETVLQKTTSDLPTAEEIRNTPGLYTKLVKQFKGDQSKVDAILMKG